MSRRRLRAWGVVWSVAVLGSSASAQPPSAADPAAHPDLPPSAAAPPEPSDPDAPAADPFDDAPPPPSAAEVDADSNASEPLAQADRRAPPEPLGPPEPVPPPVPITTETVNAPPLPPDPTSDPDSAFPPAPPPTVEGQALVAPPPSAAEPTTPLPTAPAQPVAAAEPSSPAQSATTPEAPQFRVGALAGVGVTFDHTVGGVNPLGFGFGLRGDYLLGDAWRVGARTLYFVGGHSELPTGTVEMSSWLLAVEGAYAIDLDPITLEPGLTLGFFERDRGGPPLFASQSASYVPGSQHHVLAGFYLAPGVSGYLPLGEFDRDLDLLFVGLDARFDLVFSSSVGANLQLLFELGLRF